jgi:2,3-bisphosphoglycerate-independent phosphoglycerate mutase
MTEDQRLLTDNERGKKMFNKFKWINEMAIDNGAKIVLLVMDGLGGLPLEPGGKTELETARTPNMDALTARASLGLSDVVSPGFSPGAPRTPGLFGYDPLESFIRRCAGSHGYRFPTPEAGYCYPCNFCTVDANGNITDRRRAPPHRRMRQARRNSAPHQIPGVKIRRAGQRMPFALILLGEGLKKHPR